MNHYKLLGIKLPMEKPDRHLARALRHVTAQLQTVHHKLEKLHREIGPPDGNPLTFHQMARLVSLYKEQQRLVRKAKRLGVEAERQYQHYMQQWRMVQVIRHAKAHPQVPGTIMGYPVVYKPELKIGDRDYSHLVKGMEIWNVHRGSPWRNPPRLARPQEQQPVCSATRND